MFKQCPKESISLLKEKLQKYANMEIIIRAIISTTDKDELNLSNGSIIKIKNDSDDKEEIEKKEIKKKNENEILSYLRNLIENEVKLGKEEKNVHNLYLYYLSVNQVKMN